MPQASRAPPAHPFLRSVSSSQYVSACVCTMIELPSVSKMLRRPGDSVTRFGRVLQRADAVLDVEVDQVAHVKRVIDVRRRRDVAGRVRARLTERTRIMMAACRCARLAGAGLVNVHGVLAVGQAHHAQLDRDFLYAFRQ